MSRSLQLLLVQARAPHDPLAAHEVQCIRRRMGSRPLRLRTRNAVHEAASLSWLDGSDALIIGGSGEFSVNHPLSARWITPLRRLLEAALARGVPGLGICFGHQLLGLHLGADVETHAELEEVGTVELQLTREGEDDPLLGALGSPFCAHTGHSDHVTSVPPELVLLARGAQLETQAFCVRGGRFYTTQFHPDLTGSEARERYLSVKSDEQGLVAPRHQQRAQAFRLDRDEAGTLLGRFVDVICAADGTLAA